MQRRYSKQRELILNCVRSCPLHPTPDMVYRMLTPVCPGLSRGTVYRNLNLLAEEGDLQRLPFSVERFDARTESHPHFVCERCGEVTDLDLPYNEEMDVSVSQCSGHQVRRHSAYFYGVCLRCLQQEEAAEQNP